MDDALVCITTKWFPLLLQAELQYQGQGAQDADMDEEGQTLLGDEGTRVGPNMRLG